MTTTKVPFIEWIAGEYGVCTNRSKESGYVWVIDPSKDCWLRHRQITCWRAFTAATPGPGQTLSSQCSRFNPLSPRLKASFTTIRTPTKVISGPFWPAESNRNLHLPIALLVVARVARTSPKSDGKKFRPKFLHHLVKHQQPTIRIAWRVLLDQFVAFNPPVASVCP
jgi:hypothetical protein